MMMMMMMIILEHTSNTMSFGLNDTY